MNMNMKMKTLAATISAIGAVGSAQAGAVAQSVLQVTNVRFLNAATGNQLAAGDFDTLQIVDTTNLNPTLTPGGANPYTNSAVGGAPLPLTVVCVPGVCPGGFVAPFANQGYPASFDGALAASSLDGAPISGLPGFPAGPTTGANARTDSRAERITSGTGNTTSALTLASTFSLTNDTSVIFDFDALLHLMADADSLLNATAGSGWSIAITDRGTGTEVFQWTPNGQAGGISGGTEQADGCNLTRSITAFGPGGHTDFDCAPGSHFRATTGLLLASNTYDLSISHQNQANVIVQAVPEPGSLVLAGLALAGLGVSSRRKLKSKE